jgi:hypothetical protein
LSFKPLRTKANRPLPQIALAARMQARSLLFPGTTHLDTAS